jgi:hypothetical protein
MLLNKPISSGDIVSIKLVNGEEIIARYDTETTTDITINRPLALTLDGDRLGMIPWILLGEKETITINKNHFFVMMICKKDAAKQYLEGITGVVIK